MASLEQQKSPLLSVGEQLKALPDPTPADWIEINATYVPFARAARETMLATVDSSLGWLYKGLSEDDLKELTKTAAVTLWKLGVRL